MSTLPTFARDLLDRALRTFLQTAASMIAANQLGVIGVDWMNVASVSAGAALVSVLMSWSAKDIGDTGTASLDPRIGSRTVAPVTVKFDPSPELLAQAIATPQMQAAVKAIDDVRAQFTKLIGGGQ